MSGHVYLEKANAPASMPEVLTETQQTFNDIVARNSFATDVQYTDAYDIRMGRLTLDTKDSELIPVSALVIDSQHRIEDRNGELDPATVLLRSVKFESPTFGILQILDFDSINGWLVRNSDYDRWEVSEDYARSIVKGLLAVEKAGVLTPIKNK